MGEKDKDYGPTAEGVRAETSRAPWTSAQANRIWEHQQQQDRHPLTCEFHSSTPLNVSLRGLYCGLPTCSYEQDWVHSGIAGER